MNNAPVYYCPHCKDFIIPLEVIAAFRYIKSQPLIENNINEFSFSEVSAKAKIAF